MRSISAAPRASEIDHDTIVCTRNEKKIFFGEKGVYRGSQRLRQEPSRLNHVVEHKFSK